MGWGWHGGSVAGMADVADTWDIELDLGPYTGAVPILHCETFAVCGNNAFFRITGTADTNANEFELSVSSDVWPDPLVVVTDPSSIDTGWVRVVPGGNYPDPAASEIEVCVAGDSYDLLVYDAATDVCWDEDGLGVVPAPGTADAGGTVSVYAAATWPAGSLVDGVNSILGVSITIAGFTPVYGLKLLSISPTTHPSKFTKVGGNYQLVTETRTYAYATLYINPSGGAIPNAETFEDFGAHASAVSHSASNNYPELVFNMTGPGSQHIHWGWNIVPDGNPIGVRRANSPRIFPTTAGNVYVYVNGEWVTQIGGYGNGGSDLCDMGTYEIEPDSYMTTDLVLEITGCDGGKGKGSSWEDGSKAG